ncbi:AlpA family transcriptional regulator [Acinetobacter johnsonii]|jgi:predicted DNA-binding transcriptional regulator AlpA|uniref:AlpA family transcriptional regulator n=1 Tax=Acinetobacter johnsonii TaxID=40214 RepID=UPI000F9A5A65|nr:AlpA family transcriptional regulator [Acinetobacter johnsonii]MDH1239171.1 AlpA family transcriptional regulator [Acinetobacter johnsonii]
MSNKEALHGEEDRLLKTSDVVEMVGMTRATIIKSVDIGSFPAPDWVSESGYKHWWKSTIYAHFNKNKALAS